MAVYHLVNDDIGVHVESYNLMKAWQSMSFPQFMRFICCYTYFSKKHANFIASLFNGL